MTVGTVSCACAMDSVSLRTPLGGCEILAVTPSVRGPRESGDGCVSSVCEIHPVTKSEVSIGDIGVAQGRA